GRIEPRASNPSLGMTMGRPISVNRCPWIQPSPCHEGPRSMGAQSDRNPVLAHPRLCDERPFSPPSFLPYWHFLPAPPQTRTEMPQITGLEAAGFHPQEALEAW